MLTEYRHIIIYITFYQMFIIDKRIALPYPYYVPSGDHFFLLAISFYTKCF